MDAGRPDMRRPSEVPRTLAAIVLLVIGGIIFVGAGLHFIENHYRVFITPSEAGTWRVLVPRPTVPMRVEITGQGVTGSPSETPYGALEDVSGSGQVILRYTLLRIEFRLTRFGPGDGGRYFIELTGQANSSGYMVWMDSQDVASVNVSGTGSWRGAHLGSGMNCGGPAFGGDASAGWNVVPTLFSDCLIGIDSVLWLEVVTPAFAVAGTVLLVRAYRRSRTSAP
ncbi:MAG: hypothetical protein ACE5JE_08010 [Thermoplasmata archaeon]